MQPISKAALASALLAVGAMAAAPAQAQNLVTNPSFETVNFIGWTFSGPVVDSQNDGHTGLFAAEFYGGTGDFGHLSQSIATTAGHTYDISFFLNNTAGPANAFRASFAGVQGLDLLDANAFPYTQFSFTAVATGSASILQFDGYQNPAVYVLDDVSVTDAGIAAVPETSSLVSLGLLLLLGVGGVIVSRRRKASLVR